MSRDYFGQLVARYRELHVWEQESVGKFPEVTDALRRVADRMRERGRCER